MGGEFLSRDISYFKHFVFSLSFHFVT